jgi:hypothetical protein
VRRSIRRAVLAGEAVLALTAASVAARVAGSSRTTRLLGLPAAGHEAESELPADPEVRRVGSAVERVARILPWHPVCLPQAIATRAMLRRRGVACVSHLGVYGSSPVTAHAWITVGGTVVQGGPVGHVKELALFR